MCLGFKWIEKKLGLAQSLGGLELDAADAALALRRDLGLLLNLFTAYSAFRHGLRLDFYVHP